MGTLKERTCIRCDKPIVAEYPSYCSQCRYWACGKGDTIPINKFRTPRAGYGLTVRKAQTGRNSEDYVVHGEGY